jgi:hypothetical protein
LINQHSKELSVTAASSEKLSKRKRYGIPAASLFFSLGATVIMNPNVFLAVILELFFALG